MREKYLHRTPIPKATKENNPSSFASWRLCVKNVLISRQAAKPAKKSQ
jgi:hypothetical protein